jgi:hypothetical protein
MKVVRRTPVEILKVEAEIVAAADGLEHALGGRNDFHSDTISGNDGYVERWHEGTMLT